MKLGPVTKLDNRKTATSKKCLAMTVCRQIFDVIVIFPISGQFGAIPKPDSGRVVCKTYIFINSSLFFLEKKKTELKNIGHSSHTIDLSKDTIFAKKC